MTVKLTKNSKLKIKEILELYLNLQTHDLANKLLISFLQKIDTTKIKNYYALVINSGFFKVNSIDKIHGIDKFHIYLYNLNPVDIVIQYQGFVIVDNEKLEITHNRRLTYLKQLLNL